ncbi:hypothetical protein [Nocardioides sp.]|uniref:hypothetical protein n=1 Tax=Nocardioides sp. TaxID=35761 RepID=UPI003527A538
MTKKTMSLALAAGLLAAALAGCSGDDDPGSEGSTSPSASSTGVDPGNVSPSDLPDIPVLKKEQGGARDDLELGECPTDSGKRAVKGTITSTLKKRADYLVTVSWTTSSGDVMGRGFALLKGVGPGESQDFTIRAKVADGATQCVPGVVYGKA